MPEFLTNFSNQITEYWNKFSRTQKIQIIAIFAIGLTALVVLTLVLSQPDYVVYKEEVTATEMSTIKSTLDGANIRLQISDDGTSVSVESGKLNDARFALADAGILPNDGFTYEEYFQSLSLTMSTTDKKIMAKLAAETYMAENIKAISTISDASVSLVIPDNGRTLFAEEKKASASIWLDLTNELNEDQIYGIASMVESAVENLSTDDIKIFDRKNTKLLYNGSPGSGRIGTLDSYMEAERIQESYYADAIEMLILNSGEYDDAAVQVNLTLDFDEENVQSETHTLPEGQSESLPSRIYLMEQTGTNSEAGGTPGTDSNSDTTQYVIDNGGTSESSTTITEKDYRVNTELKNVTKSIGSVKTDQSSVSITVIRYNDHNQDLLEANGALTDTTWEQYQADNDIVTRLEVDETVIASVANYANLDTDDVVIMAFEKPRFIPTPPAEDQIADYIPVIIIVLMIALLGYAVYKGTEPVEITEVEPELSVEDMLATTKVTEELEAIEFDDKSEARVQIEKFVEENPEAVAQLLRNWLNEDWE